MAVHELKTWPELYDDVVAGVKTFDVRPDDRGFAVGDELVLREWDPAARAVDEYQVEHLGAYTGRSCRRLVGYALRGGQLGVADGYVVLALAPTR